MKVVKKNSFKDNRVSCRLKDDELKVFLMIMENENLNSSSLCRKLICQSMKTYSYKNIGEKSEN